MFTSLLCIILRCSLFFPFSLPQCNKCSWIAEVFVLVHCFMTVHAVSSPCNVLSQTFSLTSVQSFSGHLFHSSPLLIGLDVIPLFSVNTLNEYHILKFSVSYCCLLKLCLSIHITSALA